jgi:hypothetical protein
LVLTHSSVHGLRYWWANRNNICRCCFRNMSRSRLFIVTMSRQFETPRPDLINEFMEVLLTHSSVHGLRYWWAGRNDICRCSKLSKIANSRRWVIDKQLTVSRIQTAHWWADTHWNDSSFLKIYFGRPNSVWSGCRKVERVRLQWRCYQFYKMF